MTTITILSKEECHLCDHAKEVVERLTEEFQLELEVVPMTTPEGQELAVRAGMLFPPAVLVEEPPQPDEGDRGQDDRAQQAEHRSQEQCARRHHDDLPFLIYYYDVVVVDKPEEVNPKEL